MRDIRRTIDAVWRMDGPRLIATLARLVRDVGLAEELAQDAFVLALEQWPEHGIPDNPAAWLTATAKHKAIDAIRRERARDAKYPQLAAESGSTAAGADAPEAVVDGPFTESKEIIAGYWLWEVSSLEEAIEWAKRCPTDPQYGGRQVLEVRPVSAAEDFVAEYTEDLAAQYARLAEEIKARHGATESASAR